MVFHSENGSLLNIFPEAPVHSSAKKFVHTRAAHMFTSINEIELNENVVSESSINISIVKDEIELDILKLSEISINENEDEKTVFECADNILSKSDIDSIQNNGATAILLGDSVGDFEVCFSRLFFILVILIMQKFETLFQVSSCNGL